MLGQMFPESKCVTRILPCEMPEKTETNQCDYCADIHIVTSLSKSMD